MKKTLACVLFTIGCSGGTDGPDGPEVLDNLPLPAAPDNGMQVITPIVRDIQPGTDNEYCYWSDVILDDTIDIKSTAGFQTEPPGHHTVLYYTNDPQPAGTQRLCTDTDMASFRFLTGNGGEGELNSAPGNLVYRAPKGAQIVINSHYLNTSDQVVNGQSAININYADPGIEYTPSGSSAFLDTRIHVQPGMDSFETTCNIDRTLKMWFLIPHMHQWGSNIKVDLTQSGETTRLFDTNWDPSFTFHPPEMRFDPESPLVFAPGDQIKIRCEWNNDTGRVLDFGFEMCVSYGQFVDDTGIGSVACDGGNWTTF
jgi:hypothetical protein